MKQEMMGWKWHQLEHMQLICTSQANNLRYPEHVSDLFSRSIFYRPDALPDAQPSVRSLKAYWGRYIYIMCLHH